MFAMLTACLLVSRFGDDAQSDLKRFQGTWEIVGFERDGKKREPSSAKVIFEGTTITWKDSTKSFTKTFQLDSDSSPNRIDLTSLSEETKGLTSFGIYAWEGDTLKLCMDSNERPTSFKTIAGLDSVLWVLKRAK